MKEHQQRWEPTQPERHVALAEVRKKKGQTDWVSPVAGSRDPALTSVCVAAPPAACGLPHHASVVRVSSSLRSAAICSTGSASTRGSGSTLRGLGTSAPSSISSTRSARTRRLGSSASCRATSIKVRPEEALASNPIELKFEKPEKWTAPYDLEEGSRCLELVTHLMQSRQHDRGEIARDDKHGVDVVLKF
ncbi:hypothetical protein GUJ93_ZPchr0005g15483 [Zizania palustris]|uniref:Uncharacterized protein n=1 Tax=Zizania palustris TaxID=103762 RepID=A0A8J5S5E7_ZIZPA|nr:hypothetical protein GUJ93_ZPchr0005g15483 [Zizania palustris]